MQLFVITDLEVEKRLSTFSIGIIMKVKQHYQNHLSQFYVWMLGDLQKVVGSQIDLFKKFNISPDEIN